MINRLAYGWNWIRLVRLLAGIAILTQGIIFADWFFIIAGVLFSSLAIFNSSCCAASGCGNTETGRIKNVDETTYEEVV